MLRVNSLYGMSIRKRHVYKISISANTRNINVSDLLIAQGVTDPSAKACVIIITVESGIIVGSANTSTPALIIPNTINARTKISIINNGYIVGAGGNGSGFLSYTTYPGGPAIQTSHTVSITNNGIIGGGGGGGAAHVYNNGYRFGGAGGGGAGDIPGVSLSSTYYNYGDGWGGGNGGATGTLLTGGVAGEAANDNGGGTAPGGNGGDLGQYGQGAQHAVGGGAAPGNAITGNSYITWVTYGDVRGPVV